MRCEYMRCEREMRRSPGWATPGDLVARGAGGTWGALGHFRGVPQGSQGGKCSLLEQKGGNPSQKSPRGPNLDGKGRIWMKLAKSARFRNKRGEMNIKRAKFGRTPPGTADPKRKKQARHGTRTPLFCFSELEDPVGPQNISLYTHSYSCHAMCARRP